MAKTVRFRLNISRDEVLRYYHGTARNVIVHAENGQRVQFPAEHIRQFIDHLGVNGVFSIRFSDDNKLIGLQRVS
ncbi:DUF2835 domain-containing protein [Pseudomonadota bacterium]|nr:DUF2835 domain-containing protein [Pseudomonadota bacterium]